MKKRLKKKKKTWTDLTRTHRGLHHDAHLISFSEFGGQQEVMLVMPAYTWVRGQLVTFFMEPVAQKPAEARLLLSSTI